MFPRKLESVPRVAELPTFQKTWHAWAPLIRFTREADALISVLAVLKMKTEAELPLALSVSVPVMPNVPELET